MYLLHLFCPSQKPHNNISVRTAHSTKAVSRYALLNVLLFFKNYNDLFQNKKFSEKKKNDSLPLIFFLEIDLKDVCSKLFRGYHNRTRHLMPSDLLTTTLVPSIEWIWISAIYIANPISYYQCTLPLNKIYSLLIWLPPCPSVSKSALSFYLSLSL